MKHASLLLIVLFLSTGCPSPSTCSSTTCHLEKKWKLQEYRIDNALQTGDLSKYAITFSHPGNFSRIGINNTADEGSWALKNNDTVLTITSGSQPPEEYIISSISDKKLELVITITDNKTGDKVHTFTLVPY